MQFLVYILVYPILWLISILPFKVLYALSDMVCFVIYRIFKYRKTTVIRNLKLVFPEKSNTEIRKITKTFYHHFCDLFLEMIKSMTISKSALSKRFVFTNPEELYRLEQLNKSIIVMYGHYASYEWSMVMQSHVRFHGVAIYKKIKNRYFDNLVKGIRSKFNTQLIDTKRALNFIDALIKNNNPHIIAILSDQSPKLRPKNYWSRFMGIKVPCFVGAEITAKKYNASIIYLKIDKVKRGYYSAEIVTLSENPASVPNFEITDMFNRVLEQQIKNAPEFYLWTHKRWKHRNHAPKTS